MKSGEHDLWDAWMATGRDRALARRLGDILVKAEMQLVLGKFGGQLQEAAQRLAAKINAEELKP